jgi:hypothetical protein
LRAAVGEQRYREILQTERFATLEFQTMAASPDP